jgi:mRNA interferase RelE/StbE
VNLSFRSSFVKDLRGIKNAAILSHIKEAIERVEQAKNLQEISNLRKLRGGKNYYCLRVGEY